MNFLVLLCAIISLSGAFPTSEDAKAEILSYESDNDGLGNYQFSFETSNGISRKETGRLVNVGTPDEHVVVQGEYSYLDAEGNLVLVQYTADENGYHIGQGAQPTPLGPPPILSALPPSAVATLLG